MSLKKLDKRDLKLILTWRNDPSVRNNMFYQDIIKPIEHDTWFLRESKKDNALWLLYLNEIDVPSGVIYCNDIDRENNHAFWGFYASPIAGSGTGSVMCKEGLDYFFNIFDLNKIYAEVIETNHISHHLHKKLGFCIEDKFTKHQNNKLGLQDVTRYVLYKKKWLNKRNK